MGPLAFLGTLFGGPIGGGIGAAAESGITDNGVDANTNRGSTRIRFGGTSGYNYSEGTDLKPIAYAIVGVAVLYLVARK